MSENIKPILKPAFLGDRDVTAVFTQRCGGHSSSPFSSLNLGYFTGDEKKSVEQNWQTVLQQLNLGHKTLIMPKLTHGEKLVTAGTQLFAEEADAIYTQDPTKVIAVTMADCLAVLLYDSTHKTVAAIHAGWKGTCLNILGKSLQQLISWGKIVPQTTYLAFSPCLQKESLKINSEIAATLDQNFVQLENGHLIFDMSACNVAQALAMGILPENIIKQSGCTLTEMDKYFSYRGEGARSGRMAAIISLA